MGHWNNELRDVKWQVEGCLCRQWHLVQMVPKTLRGISSNFYLWWWKTVFPSARLSHVTQNILREYTAHCCMKSSFHKISSMRDSWTFKSSPHNQKSKLSPSSILMYFPDLMESLSKLLCSVYLCECNIWNKVSDNERASVDLMSHVIEWDRTELLGSLAYASDLVGWEWQCSEQGWKWQSTRTALISRFSCAQL